MPKKKQYCEHQWAEEPNCQPAFRNHYHCDDCNVSWSNTHSCGRDDGCPECGVIYTPEESIKIATCACEALK